MTWHTYAQVREAMSEPFTMNLVGQAALDVQEAVNVGIDSHLEACFIPDFGDSYVVEGKRLKCSVSLQSMPVLLRRLFESDKESAIFLAADILNCIYDEDEDDEDDSPVGWEEG
jgi:hypothetical protein